MYLGLSLKKRYFESPKLWRRLFRIGVYSSALVCRGDNPVAHKAVRDEKAVLEELLRSAGGAGPYDLVLTRYTVPALDGFDVAAHIQKVPGFPPSR